MIWKEDGPLVAESRRPGPEVLGALENASPISVQPAPLSWKASPGTYGLALEIGATTTNDLREQVHLLTVYGSAFGFAGQRRRDLAINELRRRMLVSS